MQDLTKMSIEELTQLQKQINSEMKSEARIKAKKKLKEDSRKNFLASPEGLKLVKKFETFKTSINQLCINNKVEIPLTLHLEITFNENDKELSTDLDNYIDGEIYEIDYTVSGCVKSDKLKKPQLEMLNSQVEDIVDGACEDILDLFGSKVRKDVESINDKIDKFYDMVNNATQHLDLS